MSVKELLADSWSNMLKNNFILKTILVCLAMFLVYLVFIIVCGIAFAINPLVGIVFMIAEIIIGFPIMMSSAKVLWDVFQGKETSVFGFIGYGYHNMKRIWAVAGRKILKMLLLYILIFALTVGIIGYTAYTIISTASMYNTSTSGTRNTIYSSYELDLDNVDGYVTSSDNLDNDNFSLDGIPSQSLIAAPDNSVASLENEMSEMWATMALELVKHATGLIVFCILYVIVYILFIMKELFYTYSYICAFDDENLTALQAVEKSEDLMTGKRAKYFWTLLLIAVIFEIIVGILGHISDSLIIGLVSFVISVCYLVYIQSYIFTFFSKINGRKETVSVAEPSIETTVAEEPVEEKQEEPVKEDPTELTDSEE